MQPHLQKSLIVLHNLLVYHEYVSRFDKRARLSLFVNFELAVLVGSTVDELFVALWCASIAAPVPKIHSLKV